MTVSDVVEIGVPRELLFGNGDGLAYREAEFAHELVGCDRLVRLGKGEERHDSCEAACQWCADFFDEGRFDGVL